MFRHVNSKLNEADDGSDASESEAEAEDQAEDSSTGSEDDAELSDAGTVESIPDYLPSADIAVSNSVYAAPDGRRHCVLCPDRALLNPETERLHLSSKSHARRAKRYTIKLAELRAALEADDDDPIDPREIVRIGDMDKIVKPSRSQSKTRKRPKTLKPSSIERPAKRQAKATPAT